MRSIASPLSTAEEALLVILHTQWHELLKNDPKAHEQALDALGLNIKVGDKVRSQDTAGDFGMYVFGLVTAILDDEATLERFGCPRYRIQVISSWRDGQEREVREAAVFAPVNGTPSWLGGVTLGVWDEERFETCPGGTY